MTTDHPNDIAATELYMAVRLAETITATPGQHWGTTQCVAWVDSADKRCTRDQTVGHLCKRHHQVALNRLSKQLTRGHADRIKAAQERTQELPKLIAERDKIQARINQLDPPTREDNAAYVGEVHPQIRRQQMARLSDNRVSELARLYDRLAAINRIVGGGQ